jgi:colanic acid biosynthesis glycosyl transferase WcaI
VRNRCGTEYGGLKILIYSANFAPEPTGVGKYSGEMAEWLVARGNTVRVVAALPYYPQWRRDPGFPGKAFRRDTWRGCTVWRAPIWVPQSPTGLRRVLHLLSFAVASVPLLLWQIFWRPQLVITVAPAFLCAPMGWITARASGAKAWLHLQDFEVDLAFSMRLLESKFAQRVMLRMEGWVLRRFDIVSTISRRMLELLHRKGVEPARSRYFPNWVDTTFISPSLSGARYRAELGIAPETLVALFSGSMGKKQGLLSIPAAARLLAHREDIVFVVCGDGAMKPELAAAAAGMANVRLIALQPLERLGELLCLADMHLLPQEADATDLVLPSKLSGMMASGRPIITMSRPGTELQNAVSRCGLTVPPGDAAALAAAVERLADDSTLRGTLGAEARAFAEVHFEIDSVLGRLFESAERGPGGAAASAAAVAAMAAAVRERTAREVFGSDPQSLSSDSRVVRKTC